MEPKYIFAIVALSLFVVLFLIFFIMLAHRRKKEARLQAWLHEVYSDKNLLKMDYDSAEDEDSELSEAAETKAEESSDSQPKEKSEPEPEKEEEKNQPKIPDEIYDKIEIEGIEEITGNYNPKQ